MTNKEMWTIFKNTGSIEAYLAYASLKSGLEKSNVKNDKDEGNNTENQRYTG